MLAILLIDMEWHKQERNPAGALVRRDYYRPGMVDEGVNLAGDGVFVVRRSYCQQGDKVFSDQDALNRLNREFMEKDCGKRPFTEADERAQGRAMRLKNGVRKSRGNFYPPEKLDIPCVSFSGEPGDLWRVRWYDDGRGMPRRRGGNEEWGHPGAKLAGRVNTLNETAFILAPGEAGLLKYNFRHTSFEGQWYNCYYTYVVNAKQLTRDVFLREYDYEYAQMADLF